MSNTEDKKVEENNPKLDWEPSVRYAGQWFRVVADYYNTTDDIKKAFQAGQVYTQDLSCDQVFSQVKLHEWATANGYAKTS